MKSMGRTRLKKTQGDNLDVVDKKPRTKCTNKTDKFVPDMHFQTERGRGNGLLERKERFTEQNKDCFINNDNSATKDLFPYWLPWILFPLTLSVRILYVLEPTNWWILHPDEIFQTIEGENFENYMNFTLVIFSY